MSSAQQGLGFEHVVGAPTSVPSENHPSTVSVHPGRASSPVSAHKGAWMTDEGGSTISSDMRPDRETKRDQMGSAA